jgi:nitrogenase molybdenum-iron protein alpha chain
VKGELRCEPNPHTVKDDCWKAYPKKTARKRAEQIVVNERRADGTVPEIKANVRTTPGAITQRGCTYAGCKGVVIGPTRDILSITHGPSAAASTVG